MYFLGAMLVNIQSPNLADILYDMWNSNMTQLDADFISKNYQNYSTTIAKESNFNVW